jgi:hypothetical protein
MVSGVLKEPSPWLSTVKVRKGGKGVATGVPTLWIFWGTEQKLVKLGREGHGGLGAARADTQKKWGSPQRESGDQSQGGSRSDLNSALADAWRRQSYVVLLCTSTSWPAPVSRSAEYTGSSISTAGKRVGSLKSLEDFKNNSRQRMQVIFSNPASTSFTGPGRGRLGYQVLWQQTPRGRRLF